MREFITKNKKAIVIACVAILLLTAVATVAIVSFNLQKDPVADIEGGQLYAGKVYEMPKQLTLLSDVDTQNGEEPQAVQLTAKLKPSFVANAELSFSLISELANPSEYVELTKLSSKVCSIKMLKPFSKVIKLQAVAVSNSDIKAECQIDCYKQSTLTFNLTAPSTRTVVVRNDVSNSSLEVIELGHYEGITTTENNRLEYNYTYDLSDGTIVKYDTFQMGIEYQSSIVSPTNSDILPLENTNIVVPVTDTTAEVGIKDRDVYKKFFDYYAEYSIQNQNYNGVNYPYTGVQLCTGNDADNNPIITNFGKDWNDITGDKYFEFVHSLYLYGATNCNLNLYLSNSVNGKKTEIMLVRGILWTNTIDWLYSLAFDDTVLG